LVMGILSNLRFRYRHIETRTIAASNDILGPVMIDHARWQIGDFYAGRGDLRIALLVGEAHDRIGVGYIKLAADERHAEGRIEAAQVTFTSFS